MAGMDRVGFMKAFPFPRISGNEEMWQLAFVSNERSNYMSFECHMSTNLGSGAHQQG